MQNVTAQAGPGKLNLARLYLCPSTPWKYPQQYSAQGGALYPPEIFLNPNDEKSIALVSLGFPSLALNRLHVLGHPPFPPRTPTSYPSRLCSVLLYSTPLHSMPLHSTLLYSTPLPTYPPTYLLLYSTPPYLRFLPIHPSTCRLHLLNLLYLLCLPTCLPTYVLTYPPTPTTLPTYLPT